MLLRGYPVVASPLKISGGHVFRRIHERVVTTRWQIEPLAKLRVEGCCAATLAVFTRFLTAAGAIRLPT